MMNQEQSYSEDRKPSFKERLVRLTEDWRREYNGEVEEIIRETQQPGYIKKALKKLAIWIILVIVAIVLYYLGVWTEMWRVISI